jgi:hypothetical protein
MEQTAFAGTVMALSPALHRHDIDTLTIKLTSWHCRDSTFEGNYYLRKISDSTLLFFVSYSEALWKPVHLENGDQMIKEPYGFDFAVFGRNHRFKKTLSLLFCDYENPDTVVRRGNFVCGLYGDNGDTLFAGHEENGKRTGIWNYYQAHASNYKLFSGFYSDNKRNGPFTKYYQNTNQLMYVENYKDNLPDGQFTWWFSNGKMESKKTFSAGRPIGTWIYYDKKGNVIKILTFSNPDPFVPHNKPESS